MKNLSDFIPNDINEFEWNGWVYTVYRLKSISEENKESFLKYLPENANKNTMIDFIKDRKSKNNIT